MSKTTKDKVRQQRIPGTIDVANGPVRKKAEQYVELLYGRMEQQEQENVARAELIELMQQHDVQEFELDGYEIKLKHTEKDKLTVKKTEATEEDQ